MLDTQGVSIDLVSVLLGQAPGSPGALAAAPRWLSDGEPGSVAGDPFAAVLAGCTVGAMAPAGAQNLPPSGQVLPPDAPGASGSGAFPAAEPSQAGPDPSSAARAGSGRLPANPPWAQTLETAASAGTQASGPTSAGAPEQLVPSQLAEGLQAPSALAPPAAQASSTWSPPSQPAAGPELRARVPGIRPGEPGIAELVRESIQPANDMLGFGEQGDALEPAGLTELGAARSAAGPSASLTLAAEAVPGGAAPGDPSALAARTADATGPARAAAAGAAEAPAVEITLDGARGRWDAALAQRVQWLIDHKHGEARIRLNPPELGALDIKISFTDERAHVQFHASQAATREALEQTLPRLRELLAASGLELGSTSVGGEAQRGAGRPAPYEARPATCPSAEGIEVGLSTRPLRGPVSAIDLYA